MASRSQFNQAWVFLSLIVSLLIAVCSRGPAQAQAAAPPNVIAIGDSITEDFGNGGWRGPLKAKLSAVGQAINYVGSRSDGAGSHEAYGGATSCDFSTNRGSFMADTYGKSATWDIRVALSAASPNIAIIDIGTNNYSEDYSLAQGLVTTVSCGLNPESLHWLWDAVVYYPGITGVIITTIEDSMIPDGTENVNVLVRQYVADRQAQGLNVCLGELPSSFAGLTTDRFHLNAAGKDAVAAALLTPTLTAIAGTCAASVTGTLPVVTIAATANAAEPSTNGQFTVSRTGSTANPLTVNFTVSGSATPGSDYANIGTSVVIPAGSATAAIAVNVIDDTIYEGNETVVATLSPNASYAVGSANSATVTIADNESAPALSVSPNGASPGDLLTVTWNSIANATARDWLGLFAAGVGNGSYAMWFYVNCSQGGSTVAKASGACIVPLPGVANGSYEFRLFSNDSSNVIAKSNPLVVGLPVVSVAATANAAEPATNGQFTVSRTGSTASSLTVNFAVSGSATPGTDYANLGTSVVIPSGAAVATIAVNVIDDVVYEGSETVVVTLTANPAYAIGSSSATVSIADDDKPVVSIVATDATAAEAGLDTGTFTVSRDGATTVPLTVNYAVGGTAINGVDYQLLSGSLTIPAGQTSATIVVTPIDDNLFEGDETVILTLISNGSYLPGTPNSATVTIADNDLPAATPTIGLSFDGQSADRVGQGEFALNADGQLDGIFTVTLNNGSGNRTVTRLQLTNTPGGVWNTQGGDGYWSLGAASGVANGLYNAANDAVNFALTEGSSFKIFAADWQNAMFQNGVAFTLTTNFADGSSASASTTINPVVALPVVTITANSANAVEGGAAGQFTVTRTGSPAAALTVNYSIGGTATNGVDYQTLSGSVSIAAGLASASIDVIPVDDNTVEGSETVILTINPTAAYSLGAASSATVTIADNDLPPSSPAIAFSYDGLLRDRVGEGELAVGQSPDGKLDGTFTVMLNAGSGNRTVAGLQLTNSLGGIWDTVGGDSYWLVGAAAGLDSSLFNLSTDAVNFALSEGATFKIFAADWQDLMYVSGVVFTLTVTFADGSTAIASTAVGGGTSSPVISLNYDGLLRDRVGEGELALGQSPDGKLDGTFSVTLNAGSGIRTVTQLQLTNILGGIWDTIGGDSYWLVGAAVGLDSVLLNAANDAVNFPVAEGGGFKIFAPDWQNLMFVPGVKFTLTANFADGSSASSSTTIP